MLRILRADRRPASPFGYQLSRMAIDAAVTLARTLLAPTASLAAAAPKRREAPLAAHLIFLRVAVSRGIVSLRSR
jgi:hypothetical protein